MPTRRYDPAPPSNWKLPSGRLDTLTTTGCPTTTDAGAVGAGQVCSGFGDWSSFDMAHLFWFGAGSAEAPADTRADDAERARRLNALHDDKSCDIGQPNRSIGFKGRARLLGPPSAGRRFSSRSSRTSRADDVTCRSCTASAASETCPSPRSTTCPGMPGRTPCASGTPRTRRCSTTSGALLDSVYLHSRVADHLDGRIWPGADAPVNANPTLSTRATRGAGAHSMCRHAGSPTRRRLPHLLHGDAAPRPVRHLASEPAGSRPAIAPIPPRAGHDVRVGALG